MVSSKINFNVGDIVCYKNYDGSLVKMTIGSIIGNIVYPEWGDWHIYIDDVISN